MNPPDHQLFKQYPLDDTATLSTGAVPTPYHIYSGYGAFIGGTADLAAVQRLLQPEQVMPVQTVAGRHQPHTRSNCTYTSTAPKAFKAAFWASVTPVTPAIFIPA